jgi:Spy/CpxP family protein refolding chaperone
MKPLQIALLIFAVSLAGCAGKTRTTAPASAGEKAPSAPQAQAATDRVRASPDQMDPQVQHMQKELGLTEDQVRQLNEIVQDTNARKEAIQAERSVLNVKTRELNKERLDRINAVLTPEQAKKYEEMRFNPPRHVMDAHPVVVP